MIDSMGRKIDYLRISITDNCNLRCVYCMPEHIKFKCDIEEVLTLNEILKVVKACANLGISKVRITGGEPLVRNDVVELVRKIKEIECIKEVSMTTNAVLLKNFIDPLIKAGLDRINISLDTLKEERFNYITKKGKLQDVLEGVRLSLEKGIKRVKINTVIMKEVNYDEIVDLVELTEKYPIDIRFIELMPIGLGKKYTPISNDEILEVIKSKKSLEEATNILGNGPANYIKVKAAKGNIGFISAMSHKFCSNCNRIRLTKEGFLKLCLHWKSGIDLKALIRDGMNEEELTAIIRNAIEKKPEEHNFKCNREDNEENYDNRNMFQIGG